MTVRVQIAHAMPGRVRVRLPQCRGDAELFAVLERQLHESRLFHDVKGNPATGSLVLQYSGTLEDVLELLKKELPFELQLEPGQAPPKANLEAVLDPLRLVSGRDVNPMFVAGTLFAAIGLVQALRGQIMLPALSAFWYASSAFRLGRMDVGEDLPASPD
jgi:hypothetical protein